ncbi:hypothetical protein E3D03_007825 [Paracoccus sp. DMF]|nr:hypothetical protein [Paracoccus sp. DMF]
MEHVVQRIEAFAQPPVLGRHEHPVHFGIEAGNVMEAVTVDGQRPTMHRMLPVLALCLALPAFANEPSKPFLAG